jgi:flagellar basal-body rod protein FlgB
MRNLSTTRIETATTNPVHFAIMGTDADGFGSRQLNSFEITPEGNGVTLEDEMMKVTTNQIDYQTVTSLYTKSMQLIKTALGRRS